MTARRWIIHGRAQGVGFRPFVFRLAQEYGLNGWVRNGGVGVEVVAVGTEATLGAFGLDLRRRAPPLARLGRFEEESIAAPAAADFRIRASVSGGVAPTQIAPDQSPCAECLAEMRDPAARRHQYGFINCTQCGPRYTIIRALPYDRMSTSLADFPLCADCAREFADPLDRRFHAQPLACAHCGPRLFWRPDAGLSPLAACIAALHAGKIVAVRGIGGYHLMCDAADGHAVRALRLRKRRPDKPLALMLPMAGTDGLEWVRRLTLALPAESAALLTPARPIVLAKRRPGAPVAAETAPRMNELGVMLPCSPLHHQLTDGFGSPLVATSANVSGEPVLTDPEEAERALAGIADGYLHHDRDIVRPAEDSVLRWLDGELRPIRLGRGSAPLEFALPEPMVRPTIALGAFSKVTVALAWGDRVVVSPHVGSLSSARGRRLVQAVATDLQTLYGVQAEAVVCDAHPDFPTHRWARDCGLPATAIWHHHAHASALAGEHGTRQPLLCFTWDGLGHGEDRSLWGGEALWGRPGAWRRVASWRPFKLLGGGKAALAPWRTGLALCWQTGRSWPDAPRNLDPLLRRAFDAGFGMPRTSAVGRLFDAAAALLGLADDSSFEAQAPMQLEAVAELAPEGRAAMVLPLRLDRDGIWRSDWEPLLDMLLDQADSVAGRAARFHATMVDALVAQACAVRDRQPFTQIGLCGGVFQNQLLSRAAACALRARGFDVILPVRLPLNDGGISFGQIIEAAALQQAREEPA